MKLKYIVLSGIDGSGKTTKAKFTYKYLNDRGIKAIYVWFRWNAYISYFPLLVAKIAKLTVKMNICNSSIIVRRYYINKALAYLWVLTQSIDFLIGYTVSLLRAKLYGARIIIYDRFIIPDKIVDLMYESHVNVFKVLLTRAVIYYFLSHLKNGSVLMVFNKISPYRVLRVRKDLPSRMYPYIYAQLYAIILKMLLENNGVLILDVEKPLSENLLHLLKVLNKVAHYKD